MAEEEESKKTPDSQKTDEGAKDDTAKDKDEAQEIKESVKDVMANKYCDHHKTHNCTNQVPSNQSLCDSCAAGLCSG